MTRVALVRGDRHRADGRWTNVTITCPILTGATAVKFGATNASGFTVNQGRGGSRVTRVSVDSDFQSDNIARGHRGG
jgi:hypothetical protein